MNVLVDTCVWSLALRRKIRRTISHGGRPLFDDSTCRI